MKHILPLIGFILFALATPVFCQDYDGDGVPDNLDLDDDNDGILNIDEQGALNGWGLIDVTQDGTVDFSSCTDAPAAVGYQITDLPGGGDANGMIFLSTSGWSYLENPAMVADDRFEMVFDQPVNIRIASTTDLFGVPNLLTSYYNTIGEEIDFLTDGTAYNFFNGLGVSGCDPIGPASGHLIFNVGGGAFG